MADQEDVKMDVEQEQPVDKKEEETVEKKEEEETVEKEEEETVEKKEEEENADEQEAEEEEEQPARRVRPIRTRKTVDRMTAVHEDISATFEDGEGTALGDIPNFVKRLGSYAGRHQILLKLHRLLYGQAKITKNTLKSNIKKFNGFAQVTDEKKEKLSKICSKWDEEKAILPLGQLLDVDISSEDKDEIVDLIVDMLCKPEPSGNDYQSGGCAGDPSGKKGQKRKSTAKKTKTKAKKQKLKNPPGAFFMFCADMRPQLRKEMPDLEFGQTGKELGKRWKEISEEKRQEWKDLASEKRAEWLEENEEELAKEKAKKKSTKKKKTTKKKKPAAKKKSTKKKPAKKKKASKKKKKVESDSESESEDEVPLIRKQMKPAVMKIIKKADLNSLTGKGVRKQLYPKFGQDVVKENKAMIKELIDECLQQI